MTFRRLYMLHRQSIDRRWMTVLPLALALFILTGCGKSQATKNAEAMEEKYAKAKALFEERCKTSGVVVKRTVQDVEGIELTKIRPPLVWDAGELFDPMYPDAA